MIGGPRSGRSTALRTLAGALADEVAVQDLHLYGLDCGNGALLGLGELPHTGAVVTRTQVERADRLLARLLALVEERQDRLGRGGFADLAELRGRPARGGAAAVRRAPARPLDGFTYSLGEVDGGRMTEQVMRLLRDGTSVGLHLVVSGDRSLVTGRMSTLVENRVVLRLADRGDYSVVGVPTREVPDTLPDGRALTPDPVVEGQVAVLAADLSGAGQNDAVRAIARRHAERDAATPAGLRPFRLEELPASLPLDDALRARVGEAVAAATPGWTRSAWAATTSGRWASTCPRPRSRWWPDRRSPGARTCCASPSAPRSTPGGRCSGSARSTTRCGATSTCTVRACAPTGSRRRSSSTGSGSWRARSSSSTTPTCSRRAARARAARAGAAGPRQGCGSWSPGRPRRSAAGTAAGCTSCARPGRACCSPRRA